MQHTNMKNMTFGLHSHAHMKPLTVKLQEDIDVRDVVAIAEEAATAIMAVYHSEVRASAKLNGRI